MPQGHYATSPQESTTLKKTRKTTAPGKAKAPTNKPFEERFPPNTSPVAKALAFNVRRMRERLELSQAELAEAAKTGQAAIGLVELGRSNPTLHMIESIAEALGTTSAALLSISKPVRRPAKAD
jgi:ribosome-binding protein aMBF1 (putative translation factor)